MKQGFSCLHTSDTVQICCCRWDFQQGDGEMVGIVCERATTNNKNKEYGTSLL